MKKITKLLLSSALLGSVLFGCKVTETETEYVDREVEKIVEVEKSYVASITFTATSDEGKVNVTMATETEGATIYYTTNGTNSSAESTVYSEAVSITDDTEFRAIAVKEGMENSPAAFARYSVVNKIETKIETKIEYKDGDAGEIIEKEVEVEKEYASAVTFSPTNTDDGVNLTLTTATDGATIYYTTDGTTPTAKSTKYSETISLTVSTTVKAIAAKDGIENSPISVATVTIRKIKDTANASSPLKIELSEPTELSNTAVTVTAKITSASKIKRVVYKKDGSINAAALLADSDALAATQVDENDDSLWTFVADEKDYWALAAIDEAGREETEQITIHMLDKTAPEEVGSLTSYYIAAMGAVELKWQDPVDSDSPYESPLDHIEISYAEEGSANVTTVETSVSKGAQTALVQNISGTVECYVFTVYTVDKLGNKSAGKQSRLYVASVITTSIENAASTISTMTQSGIVKVTGEYDSTLLREIAAAINKLEDGIYIKLDLSELSSKYKTFPQSFMSCTKLQSIILPNDITAIDSKAFYWCTALTSMTIGSNVTSIGESVFPENISSVYFNGTVEQWCNMTCSESLRKADLYIGGTKVTELVIPDTVTEIKSSFRDCGSLTSVTIPSSVTSIGEYAFGGCKNLTSVTIQDGVQEIGDKAFCGCGSLTSITIPNTVTSIGEYAFASCSLTSVTIPASVTSIGEYAFCYEKSLNSMIFENPKGWKGLQNGHVYTLNEATFTDPNAMARAYNTGYYSYVLTRSDE